MSPSSSSTPHRTSADAVRRSLDRRHSAGNSVLTSEMRHNHHHQDTPTTATTTTTAAAGSLSESFSNLDPQVQIYLASRAKREAQHGHTIAQMRGDVVVAPALLSTPLRPSRSKHLQQHQPSSLSSSTFASPTIQAKIRKAMSKIQKSTNHIQRSQSEDLDSPVKVDVVHQELVQEELRYRMAPSKNGSDDDESNNNPHQQHIVTRMQSMEMGPGIEVPFRGTEETKLAVHRDYFVPITCGNCQQQIFCIQDAAFVLCPHPKCKAKTFLGWEENGGVGLGFTLEDLEQLQWTSRQNKKVPMPKVRASLLPELN